MPFNPEISESAMLLAMQECDHYGLDAFRKLYGDSYQRVRDLHMFRTIGTTDTRGPYEARPLVAAAWAHQACDRNYETNFYGENIHRKMHNNDAHNFLVNRFGFVTRPIINERLTHLIQNDEIFHRRLQSDHWQKYIHGLHELFRHTNIRGFNWYRAGASNLCFAAPDSGTNSVILFLELQAKQPVLWFSRNDEDQERIQWPFSTPDGLNRFCNEWRRFWNENRLNNYHNQSYRDLIELLMNPR